MTNRRLLTGLSSCQADRQLVNPGQCLVQSSRQIYYLLIGLPSLISLSRIMSSLFLLQIFAHLVNLTGLSLHSVLEIDDEFLRFIKSLSSPGFQSRGG